MARIPELDHDENRYVKIDGDDEYEFEIVGESHYQDELDEICGGKIPGGHDHLCVAYLVPEPENPFDQNAIAVFVDNLKVGYIPKDFAAMFTAKNPHKATVTADAVIVGGWLEEDDHEGSYGVRLDL